MNVDLRKWDMRNVRPLPSGDLAVRAGVRRVFDVTASCRFCGGFSVRPERSGAPWHYLLEQNASTKALRLLVVDADFVTIQDVAIACAVEPRALTPAVVGGEILVTSPDFPSLWGQVGGGLIRAIEQDSINTDTTALPIPWGICVAWADRAVIASRDALFLSDPPTANDGPHIRTFVVENALNPPGGDIYGVHVTAEGALVIATTWGVWALPEDAAASGQVAVGIWSEIAKHGTFDFNRTCLARGQLFGLTERGLRALIGDGDEVTLDEKVLPSVVRRRIAHVDYRLGRVWGTEAGPLVSIDTEAHVVDMASGVRSWWTRAEAATTFVVRGVLQGPRGEEMLVCHDGVYRAEGNMDGGLALSSESTVVAGGVAGRLETPPSASPVLRQVQWAMDGASGVAAVRGTSKALTPPLSAPIIGTSLYGAGNLLKSPSLRSARARWAVRDDDLTLELSADGGTTRIGGTADVDFKGPGARRPAG